MVNSKNKYSNNKNNKRLSNKNKKKSYVRRNQNNKTRIDNIESNNSDCLSYVDMDNIFKDEESINSVEYFKNKKYSKNNLNELFNSINNYNYKTNNKDFNFKYFNKHNKINNKSTKISNDNKNLNVSRDFKTRVFT